MPQESREREATEGLWREELPERWSARWKTEVMLRPWLSESGTEIQEYVLRPPEVREPVGYDRAFLDSYGPNDTFYLSQAERAHLHEIGRPKIAEQPAGTFAKQILNRLLIDLSWNSSRLEGNTYSLLDTKRLIDLGEEAEGRELFEAQMVLNHADAIEFLVGAAEETGFNRYTILNLHALLAGDLLADPEATGRLRHIGGGIEGSVFHPLEAPPLIEECFDQILAAASAIVDPFEQAFFAMVQLPYLQPFDGVNKRVSRLSANIPLIKANLSPLSFGDVSRGIYTEALLGVYELNRIELLRDVFIWAYERSSARYAAVRQSLGEPDPFRMRYRTALREVVGTVVRRGMDKKQATTHVSTWTQEHIEGARAVLRDRGERASEPARRELRALPDQAFRVHGMAWRLVKGTSRIGRGAGAELFGSGSSMQHHRDNVTAAITKGGETSSAASRLDVVADAAGGDGLRPSASARRCCVCSGRFWPRRRGTRGRFIAMLTTSRA